MLPSFAIAIAILQMSGIPLPVVLHSRFDPPVLGILAILGFFVGTMVVRDVRLSAHTQVVMVAERPLPKVRPVLATSRVAA